MKRAENIMIRPRPMMPRSDQISGPDAACTDSVNIHPRNPAAPSGRTARIRKSQKLLKTRRR